ncbi:MAG: pilus assembly protein TadG-related protein [Henriciella sp.]
MKPSSLRAFWRDRGAQAAILFAVTVLPILAVASMALDGARQVSIKKHLQYVTDAAALAGARSFKAEFSSTVAESIARESFTANIASTHSDANCSVNQVDVDMTELSVEVDTTCTIPTVFGAEVIGFDEVSVNASSTAAAHHKIADVSMMFDLSSSMNGTELADLKIAAKRAADIIIGTNPGVRGRVAIAPFATGVNAGDFGNKASGRLPGTDTEYDNWVNPGGVFSERVCVTERTGADAFTDAEPVSGSLVGAPLTAAQAFALNASTGQPHTSSAFVCPDSPVHPLDGNATSVKAAIDGLRSSSIATTWGGNTAGHMGIAWAWYLISPNWTNVWTDVNYGGSAAAAPHAYGDPSKPKIVILMTDGRFQHGFRAPFFSHNHTTLINALNSASLDLCAGMRADGIEIYSVGYAITGAVETMLESCTGDPARVFTTDVSSELQSIYEQIARDFLGIGLTS